MMDQAAQEIIGHGRQAHLVLGIIKQVLLAGIVPHREMHMAAAAREIDEWLGHESGAKSVLLGNGLHH